MKGIVAHILGIVNEVFLNAWLLFEKLGRDLTGAATQWIVDNKEDIKQHLQDILDFSNANQNNKLHPTQKPVALLEYLIKT